MTPKGVLCFTNIYVKAKRPWIGYQEAQLLFRRKGRCQCRRPSTTLRQAGFGPANDVSFIHERWTERVSIGRCGRRGIPAGEGPLSERCARATTRGGALSVALDAQVRCVYRGAPIRLLRPSMSGQESELWFRGESEQAGYCV